MRSSPSMRWRSTMQSGMNPATARASPLRPASTRPPRKSAYSRTVAAASTSSHVTRLTGPILPARGTVRIAIDIDSTLHHHWPLVAAAAKRRFGVELPYEQQFASGGRRLTDEQLRLCIEDTHSDAAIAGARPYAHAVETINGWYDAGHFIHITSHRAQGSLPATRRWLDDIGLRHHELYCGDDKVAHSR